MICRNCYTYLGLKHKSEFTPLSPKLHVLANLLHHYIKQPFQERIEPLQVNDLLTSYPERPPPNQIVIIPPFDRKKK
jgi:hypothetical protein